MSRIDDLAPDQRAVLQLLLGQGKSYVELSEMLRLDPDAVRQRAVSALDELGPRGGEVPPPDERAEIADYLLGQQAASQRRATRELLETSAPARAWARVVAGELRPLAGDGLPEVPAEGAEVEEAFGALDAREARRAEADRSSRVGGAVLIIGAVIVAVAIILIVRSSGGNDNKDSASTTTPTTQTSTSTTANGQPQVVNQVNMTPGAAAPKSVGVMYILKQGGQFALAVQAQDLPPTTQGRFYAAWLVGKGIAPRPLGFTPVVPSKGKTAGRLEFANALPDGANKYKRVVITAESQRNPKTPGAVALRGDLKFTR